ncbi:MAG: type II toxin-antitoxin system prevent-host-death family antitoxin [bacterium]
MKIAAGEFKTKCLRLMDHVQKYHEEIVITKFGKSVAKLSPVEEKAPKSLFGFMKGSLVIKEDIVKPIGEEWNADE